MKAKSPSRGVQVFDVVAVRRSKLRQKRIRLWIRRLRSGRYKQGKGALRQVYKLKKEERWCCLGVMIDVLAPKGWVKFRDDSEYCHTRFAPNDTTMPNLAAQLAFGLRSIDPEWRTNDGAELLAQKNDSPRPFREIADLLQRGLDAALAKR